MSGSMENTMETDMVAMMRRAHGHCRPCSSISLDVDITKRLDYSYAIAVLGFSLIVSILRTFDVRVEAARVMVSAPVLALVTTHILSMLFTGWNMIVCVAMGVAQLFLWARWTAVSRHPSNWELWVVVIA
ncbi:hypothetical protein Bca52824_086586 [Brassica carinata]|uniref:Post-GPI attachment to proteins factor 3 n=1 Tax=Brassica carinata TaxID=52824 RepID=A0A8X7PA71_BRACI|nr:hypothetical protein Bca52824_086586 [Brassica carinata]